MHRTPTSARLLGLAVVLIGIACLPRPDSFNATDTYADETLRIIVPYSAGGTYDLHARIMAPYLGTHIPGNPTVVVENMTGAGGMVAAQHLAYQAVPNGRTLGMLSSGVALAPFLGRSETSFDARQFRIIGSPDVDIPICIFSRSSGIDSLDAWKATTNPPRIGMTGPGALSHAFSMIVTRALDLPIRPVVGYGGMSDIRHAIDGDEVDGTCLGLAAFAGTFIPTSDYVVVLQAGVERTAGLERVDLVVEALNGSSQEALADLLILLSSVGRYYAFPPETPAYLVDVVADAFTDTMRDPEFLAAAAQALLATNWTSRHEVTQSMETLLTIPRDVKDLMMGALSPTRTFSR